jgi:hypothetical protein
MSEVIPCEGHSQILGIVLVTLPLFPREKQNCSKSGMTTFTQREWGIRNKILHDDK